MECYGVIEYPNGSNEGKLIALFKSSRKAYNFRRKKKLENHYCDYGVQHYENLQIVDM